MSDQDRQTSEKPEKLAVVLINLGTPEQPTAPAIRRYLREFLSDPRVVSIPRFIWLPILYLFILTRRPNALVEKYKFIWGTYDAPIRNITRALAARTERLLGRKHLADRISVSSAMTYGEPSIKALVAVKKGEGVEKFLFLPVFPQYAFATTSAAYDQVSRAFSKLPVPHFQFVADYHEHSAYIHSLTKSVEAYHNYMADGAKLIFSFHGIPQAQADAGDPYPRQCQRTAELVAHALGLADHEWQLTYQSRFGRAKWLQPYTSDTMAELPGRGTKKVLIVCPGFATDCLETIEEIRVLNRDIFLAAGGERFRYIRALNASADHANTMAEIIMEQAPSGDFVLR